MRPARSLATLLGCALLACGSGDTRTVALVRVMPAADPACGAPADGRTLVVTALGDFPASEATARSSDLAAGARLDLTLPLDTRVLTAEVIGSGGALRAIGRSAPFDLRQLADGAAIPVLMAPPLGACPTGPAVPRIGPLVARAGAGALVAGGVDAMGRPVTRVEHYDPATGAFAIVAEGLYGTPELGLAGASITTLNDPAAGTGAGIRADTDADTPDRNRRVVIAGGPAPAYQVYDADSRTFTAALFLRAGRAFHAAVALDRERVLLAGGCGALAADGTCDPDQALTSSIILDVDAGTVDDGPPLGLARIGGAAVREGPDTVLLVGGVDAGGAPVTAAERIHLSGRPGERIELPAAGAAGGPPGAGAAVRLAAGGVLAAFAPAGTAPAGPAAVILPQGGPDALVPAPAPAPRAGATLTALEDGRVLVLGGLPDGSPGPLLYEPARNAFVPLSIDGLPDSAPAEMPGPVPAHAAVRLDDGSVLVVGGRPLDPGPDPEPGTWPGAWPGAWIVRPDLTSPYTSDATLTFGDSDLARRMVPRDPARARVISDTGDAHYRIESSASSGLPSEWAVLAGPVFTRVQLAVRARSNSGLAVLLGFREPGAYVTLILIPGQPATLLRIDGNTASVIASCDGQIIQSAWLQGDDIAPSIEVTLAADSLVATIDDVEVMTCTDLASPPAGHVGLGVVGPAGAVLRIDSITVRRLVE